MRDPVRRRGVEGFFLPSSYLSKNNARRGPFSLSLDLRCPGRHNNQRKWYNLLQSGLLIWKYNQGAETDYIFITFVWCSPCCPPSYFYRIRTPPPPLHLHMNTSSLSFLCSLTPLRQGCKGADLLWFSWTRRRQREKERETVRDREGHGGVGGVEVEDSLRNRVRPLILTPVHTCFPPSELLYSSQGRSDAGNEGGRGRRCKRRQEQNGLCIQTKI